MDKRKKPKHGSIEKFHAVAKSASGMPTDAVVRLLDKAGYWDEAEIELVVLTYKRSHVRYLLGRVRTPEGQRLLFNIQITGKGGKPKNVYKNRELLTPDEFRQVCELFMKTGLKDIATAKSLAADCLKIHGVQLELFGEQDGGV